MNNAVEQLENIIQGYTERLRSVPPGDLAAKPQPDKWSGKEILGHLVDSAQNNIRRFIVAQYEETPRIIYDQDKWVSIAGYQDASPEELIQLWELLNKQMCRVLKNFSPYMLDRLCMTNDAEPHTIAWLAEDYNRHLLHHLHQILRMEPVSYP